MTPMMTTSTIMTKEKTAAAIFMVLFDNRSKPDAEKKEKDKN